MLQLFKPKQHSMLGVDINPASVTLLEISAQKDQYQIEGYGCLALPEGVVSGGAIHDVACVSASIKSLYATVRCKSSDVILAIPDSSTLTQVTQVREGLKENELEAAVWLHAESFIPYPLHEVNLDFNCIGRSAAHPGSLDVRWIAARTEPIHSRVLVAQYAGLRARAVDVESAAVARALRVMAVSLSSKTASPAQLFQEALGQAFHDPANSSMKISSQVNFQSIVQDAPQLLVALGLALRAGMPV